uniref:Glycine N-acyltransferase-like protein n=1 Tax=Zonotrichia albicollis TaxID=44394 RepID=A0A8D2MA55_ZONAL
MQILRCPAQLQLLEETLRKSLPTTLPVLGTVMTVARGNPASHEVLVDSWPNFSIVLTRLRPEVLDPKDYYTNQLSVFYRDKGALQALLEGTEAVTRERAFQILGKYGTGRTLGSSVEMIQYRALMRVPNPTPEWYKGPIFHPWVAQGFPIPPHLPSQLEPAFSIPPSAMPCCRMPPGLRLAPVSPSHISLLNATWALGGNARSRAFLLGLVRALPSACLLGPRGRPVSWSLLDGQGCLRHGYTVPAWRGRGLTGLPLNALGRELHARGFPIYCAVLPHNTASLHALQAIGFEPQPGTFHMILGTPK